MNTDRNSRDRNPTDDAGLPDLTALDPANPNGSDRASSVAAQQMLARTMGCPRTATDHVGSVEQTDTSLPEQRRGLRRRRWVVATGVVATAIGVASVPSLISGGNAASAPWTPVPAAVPSAVAASEQAQCLDYTGEPQDSVISALTERRGGITFTLIATNETVTNCMTLDPELVDGPDPEMEYEVGSVFPGKTMCLIRLSTESAPNGVPRPAITRGNGPALPVASATDTSSPGGLARPSGH